MKWGATFSRFYSSIYIIKAITKLKLILIMKKLFALFIVSLICFAVDAQKEPFMVKKFNASQIRNLDVKTSGGGITVVGYDNPESLVEVFVKGNNGKELTNDEIKEKLKNYTLEVGMEGNTLVCFAKNKEGNNWKNGLIVTFKILSPVNVNTDLTTSGGGIKMKNLNGNLRFTTSGGGLDLDRLAGDVKGRTSGGGIKILNSKENIDLITSGGGIKAENVSGNISLTTSGGGISLENMSGIVRANTSGGGIRIDGMNGDLNTSTSGGSINLGAISGSVKASTSGGGIDADIEKIGDFLVLHSSGGNINVNMPLNKGMNLDIKGNRVAMHDYKEFQGSFDKDRIQGTLNGGGANVKISTSSGHVSIN